MTRRPPRAYLTRLHRVYRWRAPAGVTRLTTKEVRMEQEKVSLTIVGEPGEEVRVVYRSNADPLPPPVWQGNLGGDGRETIPVPRARLVVVGKSRHVELRLHESEDTAVTARLSESQS